MARPKKNDKEVKSVRVSGRLTKDQHRILIKHHGSIQSMLDSISSDLLVREEFNKQRKPS